MPKKIEHLAEVSLTLKALQRTHAPALGVNEITSSIWIRVEQPKPISFSFQPVFATTLVSVIILSAWMIMTKTKSIESIPNPGFVQTLEGPYIRAVNQSHEATYVKPGDVLKTGLDERVLIYIGGAGYLFLDQNSEVKIGAFQDEQTGISKREIFLNEGNLFGNLEELAGHAEFQFTTPYGAIKITGTDFLIEVKKDAFLRVDVVSGRVAVNDFSGQSDFKEVKNGSYALLLPDSGGNFLVKNLNPSEQKNLTEKWARAFSISRQVHDKPAQKIRGVQILWRKDEG